MLDAFAATAITALTAQNTEGVHGVLPIDPAFIRQQMEVVLADIGADAVKTGMLHDAGVIDTVAAVLTEMAADIPLVLDPVMVAKGGAPLLASDAVGALKALLIHRAALLTPNAPEASALTDLAIATTDDLRRAGETLLRMGAKAVLMKGGHMPGDRVRDVLMTSTGETTFEGERIDSRHTHGTGCTLASACATGLAQGLPLPQAVARAWDYVHQAMLHAPGFGRGHGPLDHAWPLRGKA
jgi:hydroxymethylpyrimidine/phosphomethylpyrimidine kinase